MVRNRQFGVFLRAALKECDITPSLFRKACHMDNNAFSDLINGKGLSSLPVWTFQRILYTLRGYFPDDGVGNAKFAQIKRAWGEALADFEIMKPEGVDLDED